MVTNTLLTDVREMVRKIEEVLARAGEIELPDSAEGIFIAMVNGTPAHLALVKGVLPHLEDGCPCYKCKAMKELLSDWLREWKEILG